MLNILLIFLLAGGIYLLLQDNIDKHTRSTANNLNSTNSPVSQTRVTTVDPSSKTASRYFGNITSNAVDFRDGAMGDFTVGIDKENNNHIQLHWDKAIRATAVTVYNVGKLDNLTDHTIPFAIQAAPSSTAPAKQPSSNFPTVFVPNPYVIGDIPDGYAFSSIPNQKQSTPGNIFKTGIRYSIEITGLTQDNKEVSGSYTFTY